MTCGSIGFGFSRDSIRFNLQLLYWDIMPSITELGFQCPGKSMPASMEMYTEGIRIHNEMTFIAAAAEVAKSRVVT